MSDPYLNFNFLLEIGTDIKAAFHECSGLESSIDVIEHREGGTITPKKLPGMVKYANIVLKRGVSDDTWLHDWYKKWATGDPKAQKVGGAILLMDRQGTPKVRWNFREAWPAKWSGPDLNSEGNDVAIETFELAHEGIERAK